MEDDLGYEPGDRASVVNQLQLEHDFASSVIDAAPFIVLVLDPSGKILFCNQQMQCISGYEIEELQGKDWFDTFLPDRNGRKIREMQRAMVNDIDTTETVNPIQTRTGEERVIAWSNRTLKDSSGIITGVLAIGQDVTERHAAENGLRRSEERYRTLVETLPDAVAVTDLEGRIVTVNARGAALWGAKTTDELIGADAFQFLAPGDVARTRESLQRVLTEGEIRDVEGTIQRKDGAFYLGEIRVSLLRDSKGRPSGFTAVIRDVTEMRTTESALRESEELYRTLVETSPDAIVLIDLEGTLVTANEQALTLYGFDDPEKFTGMHFLDLIAPQDRKRAAANFQKRLTGDSFEEVRYAVTTGDGRERLVMIKGSLIRDETDSPTSVMAVIHDVTEKAAAEEALRKSEEQLRQSQKMEAIGSLAGGMAHDFNNLLGVITGYSGLMLADLSEADPLHENVEEIKLAAERAAQLTSRLLAFCRKQVLEPKVLDLNEQIAGMEKMLRRLLGEDLDLLLVQEPALGRVLADAGHIEQIIMNLAVNAREAMPKGGKLTIETANLVMDEGSIEEHLGIEPGAYVLLAVSDTGTGMSPEVRERAFEPFFTTKPKGKGTGLGLATIYGIVKQSRGDIRVHTEPGRGTTFKVYLPVVEAEEEAARAVESVQDRMQGTETILVVEDEKLLLRLISRILARQGYRVIEASSAGEAILASERYEDSIDMMLTDVIMPQMSGVELGERLLAAHPGMKVLYMSGYTDSAIVHHELLNEGVMFIQKPFSAEKIALKVREVLDRAP